MIFHDFCRIGYIHIVLGGEIYEHTKTYYYKLYTIFLNQLYIEIVHLNQSTANSLMEYSCACVQFVTLCSCLRVYIFQVSKICRITCPIFVSYLCQLDA
jgi:hypothetical protein